MNALLDLPISALTHQATLWQFRGGQEHIQLEEALLQACQGNAIIARLLWNREVRTPEAAQRFLAPPALENLTPWHELPDAEVGLNRIIQAIETQEAILIYGDFDVDGITGTSLFYQTLTRLNANVSYYVPDRVSEGHGLNAGTLVRLAASRKPKLVITTDTGISNFTEVSLLKGLGIDTVITDHHELPENLPLAVANINCQRLPEPTHPLASLSGAGVTFKLCQGLYERLLPKEEATQATLELLDLCAAGLVADCMPLQGENRVLVQLGLEQMQYRKRVGLRAILERAGVAPDAQLNSESIGFTIGPRINALGRLENATEAVELLTTSDTTRAEVIALHLEALNKQRQELCEKTFLEAEQALNASGGIYGRRAIVLASPEWNPGIVGIVASRLIEKYRVPTMLGMIDEANGTVRCSARSIPAFHLTEHLEPLAETFFNNFGGHAGAAGFSLDLSKWQAFKEAMWAVANANLTEADCQPCHQVDMALTWSQLHGHLPELLKQLAPFGMGNPSPLFAIHNVKVGAQRSLGSEGKHRKLMLEPLKKRKGDAPLETVVWRCGSEFQLEANTPYHVLVTLERNDYQTERTGQPTLQAVLKDVIVAKAHGGEALIHESMTSPTPTSMPTPTITQAGENVTPVPLPSSTKATQLLPPSPQSTPTADHRGRGQKCQWLDHRQRPNLPEFVTQLLLPSTTTPEANPSIKLFNEGRHPSHIPFLKPESIVNRTSTTPCHTLLLWDIPPSPSVLKHLMQTLQPTVVHVLGGKFSGEAKHRVPLELPAPLWLRGLHQGLLALSQQHEATKGSHQLPLELLASKFATTPACVCVGLALLEQLQGLSHVVMHSNDPSALATSVSITVQPLLASEEAYQQGWETTLAKTALGQAWYQQQQELIHWRRLWLES
ncbi:MAG: single-stranded-DNA-specific exonuclease RecJ, partial [Vampirovibrionales bacterium]